MKRKSDIDGVLEAWLLDGPSAMPDRVFDAVLDQVERTPQRRLARLTLRFTDMTATSRMLAAGVAAVLVVGVGVLALGRAPEPGPGVTPSPAASASPSPDASGLPGSPIPAALQHPFLGPYRPIGGLFDNGLSAIELTDRVLVYHNGVGEHFRSGVGIDGEDLVVRTRSGGAGCENGAEGRYPFTRSAGNAFLTIEPGTDDCAARATAITGTWQRSDCRDPDNWCLGFVEAGTYSTQYFDPIARTDDDARTEFGRMTFTVPDGWANSGDWPGVYEIMRASSYLAGGVNEGARVPDTISLLARPSAASLDNCAEAAEPGVGTDRAALAAWLRVHPGLHVSEQPDIVVDGLTGTVLDLSVRDDWTETCDTETPFVAAPVFFGGYHWAVAQGDRLRVILLDLPGGTTVAITVDPEVPTTFDPLTIETQSIIASFDFR